MESIRKIVEALENCSIPGSSGGCGGCPYKGKHRDGLMCSQMLIADAVDMLLDKEIVEKEKAVLEQELSEYREECNAQRAQIKELKKQTSVCFESETLAIPCIEAGEGSAAAYWHGYADALKWAFDGRFEGMAGAEVPDNV